MRHEDEKKKKKMSWRRCTVTLTQSKSFEEEAAKEKIERETVSLFQVVHEVSR